MKARAVYAAPLFVAIVLHLWASAEYAQDTVLFVIALAAIPLGGRLPLGTVARRVLATTVFVAGGIAGWAHSPGLGYGPGTLPRLASLVAVGALFAAVSRVYANAPWAGERSTFILGMIAVAASGATRLGPGYAALAALYLACTFVALRARDAARARASNLGARDRAWLVGVVAVASVIAFGFARAVPPIHRAVQRAFDRAYTPRDIVGFGGGAWLGSMRDVIRSDDEVLRMTPPPHTRPIDYLRGGLYDEYRTDGFWAETPFSARLRDVAIGTDLARDTSVRVRRISGTASHYFLPLDGRDLRAESGLVEADELGTALTFGSFRANEYTFTLGDRVELAPAPPRPLDYRVPRSERAVLAELAHAWTDGEPTPEAKLDAIQRHLQTDYRYSLEFLRTADDPLLDFLLTNKQGYCTYFASAFALVARVSGVPTRFVTGYRVAEWSPVAQEYVVRDKNAHSWVEAWIDGKWRTYDPTPMQELTQDRPHLSSLGTLAADSVARIEQGASYAVAHAKPSQLLVALAALGALWAGVRALRRRAPVMREGASARLDAPLTCFVRLAESLASRGLARASSEPLERFARRLEGAGLADAATLVDRYAAFRYGGLGDRAPLEADVARFLGAALPSGEPDRVSGRARPGAP